MMIAGALLVAVALFVVAAPAVLTRIGDRGGDPFSVMLCWVVSIVAAVGTFAVGAGMLLLPGDHPAGLVHHFADGCWAILSHDHAPAVDETVGAVALAALSVVAARFLRVVMRGLRAQRDAYRAHMNLLRVTTGGNDEATPVLWLDHHLPFAYSVSGRPGLVVASTAVRAMPAPQASAVLSHERAHLRGGHHLLVLATQALAVAAPFVPLFKAAPAAIRVLAELDADNSAVRACGHRAVHAALLTVASGTASQPGYVLSMAGGDLPRRLERVAQPHRRAGVVHRAFTRGAAVLGPAILPSAFGVSTLLAALMLACPAAT